MGQSHLVAVAAVVNYVYLRNLFASNFDKILATDEKN